MADALFDDAELGGITPALERLQKLAPPPAVVPVAPPEQWQELEYSLGMQLPQDYKNLVSVYGFGCFAGFLYVYHPFYPWKHPQAKDDYISWASKRMNSLTIGQQTFPKYAAPFPAYPAIRGLLPWGFTDNGDALCWHTVGVSNEWPLVLIDSKDSEQYDYFSMTATEFLLDWLNQQVQPQNFPDDIFPAEEPLFRSMNNA